MLTFLVIAFLAGVLSCASTCFLPLVPAYIGYMGGQVASGASPSSQKPQLLVLGKALLFVAGFTTAFVVLGAAAGLMGADLQQYKPILGRIAGAALVVMGIALLGGLPWLMRERRFDIAHRLPRTAWASYLVGLAFAVGWTPCISPVLTAILIKAADAGTAAQGAVLLGAYSLGLGVPFLVAAGLIGTFSRAVTRIRGVLPAVNGVAAVLMIGMGLLVFTNRLTVLNSYFPYFAPPFQDALSARALGTDAPPGPVTLITPIKAGTVAPDFTLTSIDGKPVTLSSLRGKPVLITFWATWCVPCREELPVISAAYLAHRDQGFTVIAVNFGQEAPDTIRKFWTDMNLQPSPFPDPDAHVSALYAVGLKTTGLPVSVFVGRDGRVRNYYPFPIDAEFLKQRLPDIL